MATDVAVTLPQPTVSAEAAFTVTQLRGFVTSTLSDSVLQTYLDAAMAAIDEELGDLVTTDRLRPVAGPSLMLTREAESITTVVEDAYCSEVTLAADDYELSSTGIVLRRLQTGTNPRQRWYGSVHVTYVRHDDPADRVRVAVALVQLDLANQPGLVSQQIGTWTETYRTDVPYAEQRAALLASLTPDTSGGLW